MRRISQIPIVALAILLQVAVLIALTSPVLGAAKRRRAAATKQRVNTTNLERKISQIKKLGRRRGLNVREKNNLRRLEQQLALQAKQEKVKTRRARSKQAINQTKTVASQVKPVVMIMPQPAKPGKRIDYSCNLWRDSIQIRVVFTDESFPNSQEKEILIQLLKEPELKFLRWEPAQPPGVIEMSVDYDPRYVAQYIARRGWIVQQLLSMWEQRSNKTFYFEGVGCKE